MTRFTGRAAPACLIAALLTCIACPSLAQTPAAPGPKYQADLRELLELMDSERLTNQLIEYLVQEWQAEYPDMPEEFWVRLGEEFKPEEFIEFAIPVYAKYLSPADLAALLEFYRSPAGRTFVLLQGAIQEDLVTAGEAWSRQVVERFIEKMKSNPE